MNSRFTAKPPTIDPAKANNRPASPWASQPHSTLFTAKEAALTAKSAPVAVTALPMGAGEALGDAVDWFLAEGDLAPSSHRVYAMALVHLTDHLGPATLLSKVTPRGLARFMDSCYPHLAPASWNRVTATLGSFFAYTTRQGWTATSPAAGLERRHLRGDREDLDRTRAIAGAELLAFLGADHPLRDKTLWWMLYETAARTGEVLALDVADIDLPRRRAVVIGKGGRAELVGWETKAARLLPRYLHGRRDGPLFLADIAPAPSRQPALADVDPDSGRARLSYRRAAEVFKTASGGRTLHQLRHSRLITPR